MPPVMKFLTEMWHPNSILFQICEEKYFNKKYYYISISRWYCVHIDIAPSD